MGLRQRANEPLNESGQGTLEMVLLMVVGISILTLLFSGLKKANFIDEMTTKPWAVVSGMIECGAWVPCGISAPKPGYHPSNRVISYRPQAGP